MFYRTAVLLVVMNLLLLGSVKATEPWRMDSSGAGSFVVLNTPSAFVGIGTAVPNAQLHVFGSNTRSQMIIGYDTGKLAGLVYGPDNIWLTFDSNYYDGVWYATSPTVGALVKNGGHMRIAGSAGNTPGAVARPTTPYLDVDLASGNVAIGAATAYSRLDVFGTSTEYGSSRRLVRFYDESAPGQSVGAGIELLGRYSSGGTPAWSIFANVKGVSAGNPQQPTGALVISASDATGTPVEVARFAPGTVHFTGTVTGTNIKAHYQDVAEWVASDVDLAPGTVVTVSTAAMNEVTASSRRYDTRVAGVVSVNPGLILGQEKEGMEMVATTGRVLVNVDARVTPIAIGDLLVTGDLPGTAIKSEPLEIGGRQLHQPGTIIGKALQSLPDGTGQILVLLSLQ